jgi:hypothetical protein
MSTALIHGHCTLSALPSDSRQRKPLKETTMKTPWKTLLLATSFAALGASAQAQMHSSMDDYPWGSKKHSIDPARMEVRMNHHLNELKRKLQIGASQEPAWMAFATAIKPPVMALLPFPDRAEMERLSTPERIDKMKQIRAQHQETMKPFMDQRDEAVKTFYNTLDAGQKKTLDAEHAHMMRRRSMAW